MSDMSEVRKFLRLPSVIEIVGIQRTAIYDRIKKGTFPAPISLGPRAVVWDSSAITDWQDKIIAEAHGQTAKK
ncbi:helix-turn-helix transcriptional regulator [Janthinobacterium sp. GB4P2]|uniref:helix-turn-helix transcriptional regulator n=1 Tax=Janthinobacterium sp. GB4P2 TaxID=3424189 RepID=UPI003F234B0D